MCHACLKNHPQGYIGITEDMIVGNLSQPIPGALICLPGNEVSGAPIAAETGNRVGYAQFLQRRFGLMPLIEFIAYSDPGIIGPVHDKIAAVFSFGGGGSFHD